MSGMALQPGAREQGVGQLDIAVQKDAVPRHQHVVEDRHGVGLLEARAERMIPFRLVAVVERLAADEAQALGVGRNAEGERVFPSPGRTENGSG